MQKRYMLLKACSEARQGPIQNANVDANQVANTTSGFLSSLGNQSSLA
jgi:spore coat protein CotF